MGMRRVLRCSPPQGAAHAIIARRRAPPRAARHLPFALDGDVAGETSDLASAIDWLERKAQEAVEAAAAPPPSDDVFGAHLRGTAVTYETVIDEDDLERLPWHRRLDYAARSGDVKGAERVLSEMRRSGFPPGPRAYHALVFACVKDRNAAGALDALTRIVKAGIQPLPSSFVVAVHGFIREREWGTAERLVWSHHRMEQEAAAAAAAAEDYGLGFPAAGAPAGEGSARRSWLALTTALFEANEWKRAGALLDRGEALDEGMVPDAALYEAIIRELCRLRAVDREGTAALRLLDTAVQRIEEMPAAGLAPERQHYCHVVTALGRMVADPQTPEEEDRSVMLANAERAERLAELMVAAPGRANMCVMVALNALLQAWITVEPELPAEDPGHEGERLKAKAERMRQYLVRLGVNPDQKFLSLQLEVALRTDDVDAAVKLFHVLKRGDLALRYLSDPVLAMFLTRLSLANRPTSLYDLLAAMSRESKKLVPELLETDSAGCTMLGAWLRQRLREDPTQMQGPATEGDDDEEATNQVAAWLVIDGVKLHPKEKFAVDDDGEPIPEGKMGVRQLRSELLARRLPSQGNKKELAKRVKAARKDAAAGDAGVTQGASGREDKKAQAVEFEEVCWTSGKVIESRVFEDEREDDEEDEAAEGGMVTEEGEPSPRKAKEEEDEEEADDYVQNYQEQLGVVIRMQSQGVLNFAPQFSDNNAGIEEALAIYIGGAGMGAKPSEADIAVLAQALSEDSDGQARVAQKQEQLIASGILPRLAAAMPTLEPMLQPSG